MPFDTPIDFEEALQRRQVRQFAPTDLSHAELQAMGPKIRERSLMMARVVNVEFGERVRELTIKIIQGDLTASVARRRLSELLGQMNYMPEEGKARTIQDLRSDVRLNLIIRMQVGLMFGYGQWRQGQAQSVLDAYPCQELFRAYPRKEPRDWPARWVAAGGMFFEGSSAYPEGRMIAMKNTNIWTAISAFGLPYPPFDFNSGMDIRDISREESIRLGIIREHEVTHPQARDFEEDTRMGVKKLSEEMEKVLIETMGEGWEVEDGILFKANEDKIQQMRNSQLITNLLEEYATA